MFGTQRSAKTILAALLVLVFPVWIQAAVYEIDPAHSHVGFKIRHIVGKVHGAFTGVSGSITFDAKKPGDSAVKASIDAASISTGNDKRDHHLKSKDFFEVDKFPTLTLESTKVTVGKDGAAGTVEGTLTMHGVTQTVNLDTQYLGTGKMMGQTRVSFEATAKINRKDFGIIWNHTIDSGGLMLGDQVEIELEIEAVEKKN